MNSVEFLSLAWRNEAVWFLYLVLKVFSVKGNRPSREQHLNAYIDKLRQDIKDNMRKDNGVIWKNLSQRERSALHRLNKNKDIVIKPADKGSATVIMDSSEYFKEAMRQLQNEQYYQKVDGRARTSH